MNNNTFNHSRFLSFWFGPIPSQRLDIFQKVFTFTFGLYMIQRFLYAYEWLTDLGFHPITPTNYNQPFALPLLPQELVLVFGIILFSSIIAVIFGFQARKFLWVLFFCAFYVQNVDYASAFTLNKIYVFGFLILALKNKAVTLEGYPQQTKFYSAWPLRILQMTVLLMYFLSGLCKIVHGDWLSNPFTLWSQVQGVYCTEICSYALSVLPFPLWSIFMYLSLIFELIAPVLFSIKRWRTFAIIWGVGFHLTIALLMHQLIYFSIQLIAFYLLFINVDSRNLIKK